MRRRGVLLVLALGMPLGLSSDWSQPTDYPRTFETVWARVDATYFDPTFGGLDWKGAHDRYLPKVTAARNDEEFYRLVNTMLWELDVSHANLVPPGLLARREPLVCAEGGPGMNVRLLDGAAVLTSVAAGSPAQKAGLRPGYVLLALDGTPVERIVEEAALAVHPPRNDRHRTALATKAVLGRLYGMPGTEVSVAFADEAGRRREATIVRAERRGTPLGPGGILYLAVELEARRLDGGIGYVRLNTLQPPLVNMLSGALESLGRLRGLVFDLRGNSGGEIEGMPGLFLSERSLLFRRRARSGETKVFADPARNAYRGSLVVLVDQLTGSAGELLAACLQATGRAVIVGERSPGAVVESDMMVLPHGAIFMYPVAQLATPDGTALEGWGVVPDIEVRLDRRMLLKGVDSQVQAAVMHLEKTLGTKAGATVVGPPDMPPIPAAAPRADEHDRMILNDATLNGALELLPDSLATMAIIPLQMKSGFSLATTCALGRLAVRYYAGGRTFSTRVLKDAYASLLGEAKGLQNQYLPAIRERAHG